MRNMVRRLQNSRSKTRGSRPLSLYHGALTAARVRAPFVLELNVEGRCIREDVMVIRIWAEAHVSCCR